MAYSKLCNKKFDGLDEDIFIQNTGLVKFIRQGKGYCFNYALKNYNIPFLEDSYEFLVRKYESIPKSKAKKGDIITIHNSWLIIDYTLCHLAIIKKLNRDLNSIIIRSKWGELGIYEGKLEDLPEIYGHRVVIWRKRR
jgi:hypothetical protein